jgi:hypothetical protein
MYQCGDVLEPVSQETYAGFVCRGHWKSHQATQVSLRIRPVLRAHAFFDDSITSSHHPQHTPQHPSQGITTSQHHIIIQSHPYHILITSLSHHITSAPSHPETRLEDADELMKCPKISGSSITPLGSELCLHCGVRYPNDQRHQCEERSGPPLDDSKS